MLLGQGGHRFSIFWAVFLCPVLMVKNIFPVHTTLLVLLADLIVMHMCYYGYFMIFNAISATISMRALMHVADNIGELWSTLVIVLEIPPPKVHNITATCFNIPHRALAVLHEWYSRDPENATKEALINALRDIPCNDIADEILEM